MANYKFLMIHCTATIQGQNVDRSLIERMHMGPKDLSGGKVRFKGVNYASREALPNEKIGGKLARSIKGRGWDRVGYSRIFFEDGSYHSFVDHNGDNWIDSNEITYGAVGFNSVTKHFVYAGGLSKEWEMRNGRKRHFFKNTMTPAQEFELVAAVKKEIRQNPKVKIIGHNQTAVKGCPCFDVRDWCRKVGIPEENIDKRPLKVKLSSSNGTTAAFPIITKKQGDKFRAWVNDSYPDYAQRIDLDRSGSHNNSYIRKAWAKHGKEYQNLKS